MMPLTMARPGETVTIRKITGRDEVRQSDPAGEGQPGGLGQDHGESDHDLNICWS